MVVEDRYLSWGLTAGVFALLVVFSTTHGGWWRSPAVSVTRTQTEKAAAVEAPSLTPNPFAALSEFVPASNAEVAPAAATARENLSEEPERTEPPNEEADLEAAVQQRNRGVEHSSRTH